MGVLRTSILLVSVALEVGGLLAAMVAGEGLLQIDAVSTSIKPYYSPMLPPSSLPGSLGGMAPLSSRSSEGGGMDSDNFSNTGDLDPPRVDMAEQPSSSSSRPSLLRNLDCWISIRIYGVQAVLAARGNDGGKVGAAPRKGEEDKHNLDDGAPP